MKLSKTLVYAVVILHSHMQCGRFKPTVEFKPEFKFELTPPEPFKIPIQKPAEPRKVSLTEPTRIQRALSEPTPKHVSSQEVKETTNTIKSLLAQKTLSPTQERDVAIKLNDLLTKSMLTPQEKTELTHLKNEFVIKGLQNTITKAQDSISELENKKNNNIPLTNNEAKRLQDAKEYVGRMKDELATRGLASNIAKLQNNIDALEMKAKTTTLTQNEVKQLHNAQGYMTQMKDEFIVKTLPKDIAMTTSKIETLQAKAKTEPLSRQEQQLLHGMNGLLKIMNAEHNLRTKLQKGTTYLVQAKSETQNHIAQLTIKEADLTQKEQSARQEANTLKNQAQAQEQVAQKLAASKSAATAQKEKLTALLEQYQIAKQIIKKDDPIAESQKSYFTKAQSEIAANISKLAAQEADLTNREKNVQDKANELRAQATTQEALAQDAAVSKTNTQKRKTIAELNLKKYNEAEQKLKKKVEDGISYTRRARSETEAFIAQQATP